MPLLTDGPDLDALVEHLRTESASRPLRLLSLGAGVQSTTLALLAEEGHIPPIDGAIFADTGWEPARVYEHLQRLADAVSFPVMKVAQGNLRDDATRPEGRFAAIPYFILNAPFDVPIRVTCPACAGGGEVVLHGTLLLHGEEQPVDDEVDCPRCGGVGKIDDPSGRTRPATMDERQGMGRRQCTSEYKLTPIRRKVRELLGARAPEFLRVPKGRTAVQLVGFSTDEVGRANRQKDSDGVSYLDTEYPLLDLGMSRNDCDRWLRARGWTEVAKSACIGCPYSGNAQWRDLRDNRPDEWQDAIAFDEAIRKGSVREGAAALDGEAFLHRSMLPLAQAPIDKVRRKEWREAQVDLFDAVADQLLEDGDLDGCSPYGCRSGAPVA